jgi:hypothetical protein
VRQGTFSFPDGTRWLRRYCSDGTLQADELLGDTVGWEEAAEAASATQRSLLYGGRLYADRPSVRPLLAQKSYREIYDGHEVRAMNGVGGCAGGLCVPGVGGTRGGRRRGVGSYASVCFACVLLVFVLRVYDRRGAARGVGAAAH